MLFYCAPSCQSCDQLEKSPKPVTILDWGEPQLVNEDRSSEIVRKMNEYMTNEVMVKEEYESVRQKCKNKHRNCAKWAAIGKYKYRIEAEFVIVLRSLSPFRCL